MKLYQFSLITLLVFASKQPLQAQISPWSVADLDCYTKELSKDSTAFFYYEEGLPFTHLYYHDIGSPVEEASEVYLISSEFFPSIESSASMAFLLFRPYVLSAQEQEFHYQGDLTQWNEVAFMTDKEVMIIGTASTSTRTAELTVQRVGDQVDWFIIINQEKPLESLSISNLCSL